ncbi:D-amino-acid transaminase [Aquibacillus sp. 3ASR75-11]|uniref:D-alanine aminotransferase n=1 Tax=Terrihalobacillus insolitus TaxID=2950438 RepID=A0A9X3WWH4_9BACI|nr:D-amino-acid transaminase [Terrihalobacillus insolitus]MDC3413634.1 D-amino-acid transaminase [Terrihalobacillus insolitus]MDC3424609.1 D-amino-acid transaminase [Terrihalobacillus insolitus]
MTVHRKILTQHGFVDKDLLTYPYEERGLQFGDGIYEVIRIYHGDYYLLTEHVERLFRSAAAIKLTVPYNKEQVYHKLAELLEINDVKGDAKVYLQITRGSAARDHVFPDTEPNFYAYVQDLPRPLTELKNGVSVITQEDERWQNCYIKSLNLLPNILAKQEAKEQNCFEAILHRKEKVTECSSSNVYIVKDGKIYTHPETNNILHGCVRSKVKTLAQNLNIPLIEEAFTLEDLQTADEVFLTSSNAEVMPIISIDHKQVQDGKPGTKTISLQKAYEQDAKIEQDASIFQVQ